MILIALEGNIGIGKSTVLAQLRELYSDDARVVVVDEPVDVWQKSGLLQAVYDGSLSRAVFQQVAVASRVAAIARAARGASVEVVVSERSPYSDRHVFATSNLSGIDAAAYDVSFDDLMSLLPAFDERRFVVLSADLDTVVQRVRARARGAESTISREYLAQLGGAYDRFVAAFAGETSVVDARADKSTVLALVLQCIEGRGRRGMRQPESAP